jgi:hypothetical protein
VKSKNRSKKDNLLARIAEAVQSGRYVVSSHAFQRTKDRLIPVPHVEHVLLHGFHEQRKDKFDAQFDSWNYAIRGVMEDFTRLTPGISPSLTPS